MPSYPRCAALQQLLETLEPHWSAGARIAHNSRLTTVLVTTLGKLWVQPSRAYESIGSRHGEDGRGRRVTEQIGNRRDVQLAAGAPAALKKFRRAALRKVSGFFGGAAAREAIRVWQVPRSSSGARRPRLAACRSGTRYARSDYGASMQRPTPNAPIRHLFFTQPEAHWVTGSYWLTINITARFFKIIFRGTVECLLSVLA